MKKYAIVLLGFEILIGKSLKAQHDVIDCTAMKEKNENETEYAAKCISNQRKKWYASQGCLSNSS